jgi:hypothetical protein
MIKDHPDIIEGGMLELEGLYGTKRMLIIMLYLQGTKLQ